MMPIDVTVAKASIAATAKLLSSIGLGGLAALQPGVLDANAIRSLSRLTYWVFQPAFLFCSVSKTLHNAAAAAAATTTTTATTGLSLAALWLLPCLAVTQIAAGAILGRIVAATFQIADHEVPNVRMCTTFANSGPLPLIFTDALFGKNPLLQSQMAAGISFYLLAWSPLFWTVGKIILGTSETKHSTTTTATAKQDNNNNKPLFWSKIVATTQQILSPPVLGSIAGLLVGVVAPLRNLFFQKGLLEPLYGALHTLGTAYLPAALLVLAGSLVGKRSSKSTVTTSSDEDDNNNNKVLDDETNNNNNNNDKPTARGIAAIATYRFLISPALTWIMASFLQGLSWMDGRTKAIITFLCLMEGCMPPAQNSVIMLQLVGLSGPAAAMAKLLTLLYAGAVIPVTLLLTACLQKSGIMAYL